MLSEAMPQFETHITVSALGSAFLVSIGGILYGWGGAIPALALVAGTAGGQVPDLDAECPEARRAAALSAGLAAAVAVAGFFTASGSFLDRPWTLWPVLAASALACGAVFLIAHRGPQRPRGLCHSLAAPFIYGGLWACLTIPRGTDAALAVWLLAVFGVLSHLVLDAARDLSLAPLKLATADLTVSTWAWLATTAITLAAFFRLTRI